MLCLSYVSAFIYYFTSLFCFQKRKPSGFKLMVRLDFLVLVSIAKLKSLVVGKDCPHAKEKRAGKVSFTWHLQASSSCGNPCLPAYLPTCPPPTYPATDLLTYHLPTYLPTCLLTDRPTHPHTAVHHRLDGMSSTASSLPHRRMSRCTSRCFSKVTLPKTTIWTSSHPMAIR